MAFPKSNPRRWLEEVRALRQLLPRGLRVVATEPAVIEGKLGTAAGLTHFRAVLPPEFPLRPPSIWELNANGDLEDHRATGHAFTDGSICLYGHTPETGWRPEFTAANALEKLRTFLDAADRGQFPFVDAQALELPYCRVSIHPRLLTAIRANVGWGMMGGYLRPDGRLVVVTDAETTTPLGLMIGSVTEAPSQSWGRALGLVAKWHGLWCRVDAALEAEPPSRERLAEWLHEMIPFPMAREMLLKQPFLLLVGDSRVWFVWLNPPAEVTAALSKGGTRALYTTPVVEDIPTKLFARTDARVENAIGLRNAPVAVIGLGSLGGSVALSLAKAGVGRFVLIDPDVLEPENLARHVGGALAIGIPKVEAVARIIHQVNPDAEITLVPTALSLDPSGWHGDVMGALRAVLDDPLGVVVCLTATADAENVVNAVCVDAGTPAVFGAVLGQAEHGRVFRVIPGLTACYQCILIAQARDPGRFPRFTTGDNGVPVYGQPGIPGLGLDIDEVAILAARMTLQTIATRVEGGVGYPPAHSDHILWSAVGGWAVDGPLQTRAERIPRQPDCPVCGGKVGELDAVEQAELLRLLAPQSE